MSIAIHDVRLRTLRVEREIGTLEPAWDVGGSMRFQRGGGSIVEIHAGDFVGIGPGCAPHLLPKIRDLLIGEDPFAIEHHAERMLYYVPQLPYQGGAGIDIALWDLVGKLSNQPLYRLWGGGRDKVPAYASMVKLGTVAERVELARQLADQGWQAIKLRIHYATVAEDIALVEGVMAAVGDRMAVMVDANQAQSSSRWQPGVLWNYDRALQTAQALDRMGVYWLEEPLPRYAFDQLARLNGAVGMPIAGGENNPGLHEFRWMCEQGVYDLLQPESMVLNGITALLKVGQLARFYGKRIAPHHGGRGLGTVAHLHLVASWSHAPYLELLHDPPIADCRDSFAFLLDAPAVDAQGFMAVPQRPGLGVTVNPDLFEE